MGLLADAFSYGDSLKRKIGGLLADPMGTIELGINRLKEDNNNTLNLFANAYPMAGDKTVLNSPKQKAAMQKQLADYASTVGIAGMTAPAKFVYPREEALATAQRNAAKPFAEGGLGLRPDNTAAERARAMGYPTAQGKELYHSARGDWESSIVDPSKSDIGFHIGTLEQAENRAKAFGSGGVNFDEGANVMPVVTDKYANFLKLNDTGTFHADGIARQLEKKGLLAKGKGKQIEQEIDANFRLRQQYDPLMRDALARNEFDGIKYANQQEGSGLSYAITNPSVVRSRFAAFDPARRNEADLLGRADPALLGILGGGSLLGLGAYNYGKE